VDSFPSTTANRLSTGQRLRFSRSGLLKKLTKLRARFIQTAGCPDCGDRETHQARIVFFSRPYAVWERAFGPIEVISNHCSSTSGGLSVQVWKQPCSDGPVICVGHVFEHPSGVKWVLLVRLCIRKSHPNAEESSLAHVAPGKKHKMPLGGAPHVPSSLLCGKSPSA
jgi:hypothetical protein